MSKFKQGFSYLTITSALVALMYWTIFLGAKMEQGDELAAAGGQSADFLGTIMHNFQHPLALLLAQIATIIVVARVFGWICTKIKQPVVVGEMIAGIMLGPSFLGMHFPEFFADLFPRQPLGNLQFISQVGLMYRMLHWFYCYRCSLYLPACVPRSAC